MISSILMEGLIFAIMVLGLFMTFRVLNFCDMTVDGSFPLGACVLAICVVKGINPGLAMWITFSAGMTAGLLTNLIYTYLKIPDLLAGILMMTMLYSVNIRVLANKANQSLLNTNTIFDSVRSVKNIFHLSPAQKLSSVFENFHFNPETTSVFTGYKQSILGSFKTIKLHTSLMNICDEWAPVLVMILIIALIMFLLTLFFNTDLGLTMGALGSNPQMVISQGVNPVFIRAVGICFGDGLSALSGGFFAMYAGFADVGSGSGVVVSGLASLMLGEFLLHSNKITIQLLRVVLGSILYRALMFLARKYGSSIGMNANDLKLITGMLIIICLIISKYDIYGYLKKHLSRPEGNK